MQEGFMMNLRTAELFFRFCKRHNVDTEANRIAVMRQIVAKKKAKYLRNPSEVINGGQNVLFVKKPS